MSLREHSGYLYLHSKELEKQNKKLASLRVEEEKIESAIEHAREGHKERLHEKALRLERKMENLKIQRETLLKRMRSRYLAFENLLEQEEKK